MTKVFKIIMLKSRTSIICALIITVIMSISGTAIAQKSQNESILDSLEVLTSINGLIIGRSTDASPTENRYNDILDLLFSDLNLSQTQTLLKHPNKYARCYGFMIFSKQYFHSLSKNDLEIFNDTAKIFPFMSSGKRSEPIPLGVICKMLYESQIEATALIEKEGEIREKVQEFILENSKYPKSYKSVGFAHYSWGQESGSKRLHFEIAHEYKIKQADGKRVKVKHYFVFNNDLQIFLIEKERSKIISAPIDHSEWRMLYGKD